MPHLIIEYSQQQAGPSQVERMLDAVHQAALQTELFEPAHIRVRAIPVNFYRTAGVPAHFIHAQCRIHGGRDAGQKSRLSQAVLAALKAQQWAATSITVEVVDMDRATYAKHTETK